MALVSGEAAYVDAPSLDTEGWELPLLAFVLSTRDLSVVAACRRLTKFPALDLLAALHTDRTGRSHGGRSKRADEAEQRSKKPADASA